MVVLLELLKFFENLHPLKARSPEQVVKEGVDGLSIKFNLCKNGTKPMNFLLHHQIFRKEYDAFFQNRLSCLLKNLLAQLLKFVCKSLT